MRLLISALQSLLCVSVAFLAGAATAVETTLAIDSTLAGVPSTPGNFFLSAEKTAVWLTASCKGNVVAAQVYWTSQFTTEAPSHRQWATTRTAVSRASAPPSPSRAAGWTPARWT